MKNAIVNPSEPYLCLLYALHWPYYRLLEYGISEYLSRKCTTILPLSSHIMSSLIGQINNSSLSLLVLIFYYDSFHKQT